MNFHQKLNSAWTTSNSSLCVGLDPDLNKMPAHLRTDPLGIQKFCIDIVDATADTVCAFKPQIAYFAAVGAEAQLQAVCDHVRTQYPHIVLILDAKRGDIGDTSALYAREAFERYGADGVWWSFSISAVVAAVLSSVYYLAGTWRSATMRAAAAR